ncbi:MAG: ATPase domain-containing protein, partial [Candidatus Micrarchaeia archaeon]
MMRCKTGIKGFDELVEGGFPKGSTILIAGDPGTGKTIFGLQFIYNGAVKFNEKGLYLSLEQTADAIRNQALQFGWDLKKLEEQGKLKIVSIPVRDISSTTAREILEMCRNEGIKRLVIDSLSTLAINAPIYATHQELSIRDVIKEWSPDGKYIAFVSNRAG